MTKKRNSSKQKPVKRPSKALLTEIQAVLDKHRWPDKGGHLSSKGFVSLLSAVASAEPDQRCEWVKQPDGSVKWECYNT